MAKLSISDVEHIAKLSRLELSPAEKEKFANQLSGVLEYVEQLKEVDTQGVEPTAQVAGISNVTAADEIQPGGIDDKKIAINAPSFDGKSYVVPQVFEGQE